MKGEDSHNDEIDAGECSSDEGLSYDKEAIQDQSMPAHLCKKDAAT